MLFEVYYKMWVQKLKVVVNQSSIYSRDRAQLGSAPCESKYLPAAGVRKTFGSFILISTVVTERAVADWLHTDPNTSSSSSLTYANFIFFSLFNMFFLPRYHFQP